MRWLLVLWALLGATLAPAQDVQPVPALSARVIDQTGTLADNQRAALESKLAAFEAASGPQIVLLLVNSTAPEDIAAYAQRVADSWKIGRRDVGDGVLLVVSKGDRRVRIEVAKALEGAIPDLAARQIIDNAIRPAFRADDYAGGLNAAVDQIQARIKGEGPANTLDAQRGHDARPAVGRAGHVLLRGRSPHRCGADRHLRAPAGLAAHCRRGRRCRLVVFGQRADRGRCGCRCLAARRHLRHWCRRQAGWSGWPATHRRLGRRRWIWWRWWRWWRIRRR
jgi:hypothetical protein